MTARIVQRTLRKLRDPQRAKASAWFFKTGKGEYGEGDQFLGIKVPDQRKVAHRFIALPLSEIKKLLQSPVHEDRFVALEILVAQYERDASLSIPRFYLANTRYINNWDLVDTSAPYILGPTVTRQTLLKLARSKNMWERRIAIVATFFHIKDKRFADALTVARMLLSDTHDLIHKAVGWMLREVGKQDVSVLETFLEKHIQDMPRTMLRYAIEKFPPAKRKAYLAVS